MKLKRKYENSSCCQKVSAAATTDDIIGGKLAGPANFASGDRLMPG